MPAVEDIPGLAAGEAITWDGSALASKSPSELAASAVRTINAQTGTTYTLVVADANQIVTLTNADPITLTVPTHAAQAIPVGSSITIFQMGAGQVTVTASGGVTANPAATFTNKLLQQGAEAVLTKLSTTVWGFTGVLEAA